VEGRHEISISVGTFSSSISRAEKKSAFALGLHNLKIALTCYETAARIPRTSLKVFSLLAAQSSSRSRRWRGEWPCCWWCGSNLRFEGWGFWCATRGAKPTEKPAWCWRANRGRRAPLPPPVRASWRPPLLLFGGILEISTTMMDSKFIFLAFLSRHSIYFAKEKRYHDY